MDKKPVSLMILLGGPKGPMPEKGSREASMKKLNKMAAEEAKSNQEGGEGEDWSCPDCGTVVMATMPKKSMKCPCCGAEMEMDDEAEDMEEGEYEEKD